MDMVVMPDIRSQQRPASASCSHLQSRQFPAHDATPEQIKQWSLTSPRDELITVGARPVSHARYVAFQMAEVAISRHHFAEILWLIAELRRPPGPAPV
jgi:hypothetical protein